MPLRLYNTLTRQVEPFIPGDPAKVTFYSCGPTVYDDAHIGNFRSFLAADVLRRFIESPLCELDDGRGGVHRGPRSVAHVMNITDVGHMTDDAEGGEQGEDRMAVAGRRIAEAKKSGALPAGSTIDPADPYAIANFYADRFLADARLLGLGVASDAERDPTLMPRPTAKIAGMVRMILDLIAKGRAYAVGPPGRQIVYFDVQSFPEYGRLSGNTLDRLRTGAGGRISDSHQQQKKHPADFLLWKADPAHVMKWDPASIDPRAGWGVGYPGWHIECSVMAAERLADAQGMIDLHSGGEDNIFPHHECEIAQSRGCTGAPGFARMWFHPRHLFVEGAKMSKSKGNFHTIRDLTERGFEPAAIRLELIRTHYRSNANFTEQGLKDSARMVERWRRAAGDTLPPAGADAGAIPAAAEFAAALQEDLNIAGAIAVVNTYAAKVESPTAESARAFALFDQTLSVLARSRPAATSSAIGVFLPGVTPDAAIIRLLEERSQAKAARDFERSDAIRDELSALGLAIKDVAGGKVEVRRTS
ncbi:MAG: cysteine--tRNA ligase [Phycisphaerales bacterium]